MRTINEIRAELDEAVDRRADLWHELAAGVDEAKSAEAARISSRIAELWAEARAEERLERDTQRKAA